MKKRSLVFVLFAVLLLVFAQSIFAAQPEEFRTFDPQKEEYSLEEAFWFNPTIYATDALQFIQAYLNPDNPVDFYLAASKFTDEEIEEHFVIFQSFFEPEYVGYVDFNYSCDVEAFAEAVGYVFDPELTYSFSILFEDLEDIQAVFPRGIGRTDSYNTFRRSAISLAWYAMKNGKTPGFDACNEYIEYILALYEAQFEEAMAAEAQMMTEYSVQ